MATIVKFQCPDCGGVFKVPMGKDDPYPNYCQACGAYVGTDPDFVPSQVNIFTNKGKVVDGTYRAYSDAMNAMAERTGNPALKITNMRDNMREGDVAAMPVNNSVTQYAEEAKKAFGFDYFQANANAGSMVAASKADGPQHSGTGAPALAAIQESRGNVGLPVSPRKIQGSFGGGIKR